MQEGDEFVPVRLIQHGERVMEVDRQDLETALSSLHETAGQDALNRLFEDDAEDIELDTVVILPDGNMADVCRLFGRVRPSTRSAAPVQALTAAIAATPPRPGCGDCTTSPCPQHLAEDLLAYCPWLAPEHPPALASILG